MIKPKRRKKRSKLVAILMAPIVVVVMIVGWGLYWIGDSRQQKTKKPQKPTIKTRAKQDEVELIMIPQQEEQVLAK